MAVTVKSGPAVYSLTSPPEQPTPYPPSELIAEAIHYGDRTILVTVPFPDTIELVADVLNEHLTSPYVTGGSAKKIAKQIDNDLWDLVKAMKEGDHAMKPKSPVNDGPKAKVVFDLPYDLAQPLNRAQLTLWREPDKTQIGYGSWQVKVELSASKAGPAGLVKLIAAFEDALPLSFAAMLPDFRVARVDPAIDLIGAYPLDLIAHISKPGKRMVFVGSHGRPESIYLYERKTPLKKPPSAWTYNTRGTLRLKMYERRDYFHQLKLDPPYGPCPVTRIEIEHRWKKKTQQPKLMQLAVIKNLLKGRRVTYAAALASEVTIPKDWLAFCLAAFGAGIGTAQRKWRVATALKYPAIYADCAGDLIDEHRWVDWEAGLKFTGISVLIETVTEPS